MTFEEYLAGKKIDSKAFALGEKAQWEAWRAEFAEMHPNSFTSQKLFLINKIRRRFPLPEAVVAESSAEAAKPQTASPAKPKPVMRPKIN